MKKSKCSLKNSICVTELVKHIDSETANIYKGTQFENTYRWVHDALNQMCDSVCRDWMKEHGYWDRWVTPELGLNDQVVAVDEEKYPKIKKLHAETCWRPT